MEIFRNNEQGYFAWLAKNPEGFVLNSERKPTPRYLVLHLASCGHISGHTSNYADNAFTGRNYIKICSENIDEIRVWVTSIGGVKFSGIYRDCQPPIDKSIGEAFRIKAPDNPEENTHPRAVLTQTLTYQRDQGIVKATLERAQGICDCCHQKAPFIRKSDNEPYLEVHHTVPLSQGGEDTLNNTQALCPNCHREAHFG